jgi:integrase
VAPLCPSRRFGCCDDLRDADAMSAGDVVRIPGAGWIVVASADAAHGLLTGLRTEEVRALRWDHIDLDG